MGLPSQLVPQAVLTGGDGGDAHAVVDSLVEQQADSPWSSVAQNDNATTGENQPLTGNVLPNDTDVDGNLDTTSVILISGPTNGTLVLNPDGTFTYTPDPNFVGTDQFTYEVCDTGIPVYCDQAVMVITVVPLCPGDLAIDSILPVTNRPMKAPPKDKITAGRMEMGCKKSLNSSTSTM